MYSLNTFENYCLSHERAEIQPVALEGPRQSIDDRHPNARIEIDAKSSQELLKSIRLGKGFYLPPDSTMATFAIKRDIALLRKDYLLLKPTLEKNPPTIRNIVFYQILKTKYPDFSYSIDQRNRITSNLHRFKINGKIPSLATMLLNESFVRSTEPERRYGTSELSKKYGRLVESLFEQASLIYPDTFSFHRFLELLNHSATHGTKVILITAICPDYSYTADETGTVRYTFDGIGSRPGLAGEKYISSCQP